MQNSMQNNSWHAYPSIFAMGHRVLKELLDDPVIVEEKVDGSQFSFGIIDGQLRCKSKGKELVIDAPEKMFSKAVTTVQKLDLHPGWTYRAEYLQSPKHNALAYDRVPVNHLMVFDINIGHEEYLDYGAKKAECERIGLECVPLVYAGYISDSQHILSMIDRISVLGGQKVEGVVIKNYAKFGPDKKVLIGKFVSEAFKEIHAAAWKNTNPTNNDVISKLTDMLRTPARWNKAIQHLKEAGNLDGSPKDIGNLIKEVQTDIQKECTELVKDRLFEWAMPQILRGTIKGLPEWYKEELLKGQFGEEQNSMPQVQ